MSQFTYPGPGSNQQPPPPAYATVGNSEPGSQPPPAYSPQYVPQSPNPIPSAPRAQIQLQQPQSIQPVYQAVQQQPLQQQPLQQGITYVQQMQQPQNVQLQVQQPGANVQYQVVQPVQSGVMNVNPAAYPAQMQIQQPVYAQVAQIPQNVQPQRISLQVAQAVDQRSNNQHLQQYAYEPKADQPNRPENKSFGWLQAFACISCLLCCPIGGCSLYLSFKASDQYKKKNYLRSDQNKRKSLGLGVFAIVLFLIIVASG